MQRSAFDTPGQDRTRDGRTREEDLAPLLVRALPRLRRYAQRRVGAGRADDVVQETLVRALESADSFDRERDVWPWLRTVLDRVVLREAERDARAPAATGDIDPPHEVPPSDDPLDEARAMLDRLRGPERDTLERHYLRGESVAAIASATGAAVGTVKARLSRGRRRLVLLCGAALSTVLAALALAPGSAGAKGARIHRATFVVEVRKPDAPCFRRVVLPLRSTADESADGWRIEGAWRIDDATEDTETGRLEPR